MFANRVLYVDIEEQRNISKATNNFTRYLQSSICLNLDHVKVSLMVRKSLSLLYLYVSRAAIFALVVRLQKPPHSLIIPIYSSYQMLDYSLRGEMMLRGLNQRQRCACWDRDSTRKTRYPASPTQSRPRSNTTRSH